MEEPHSSNFRVITTNVLGVRIFRKFMVDTKSCFSLYLHKNSECFCLFYTKNVDLAFSRTIQSCFYSHHVIFTLYNTGFGKVLYPTRAMQNEYY